jgi:glycosyltransferase involved in cell wall biosynthesis
MSAIEMRNDLVNRAAEINTIIVPAYNEEEGLPVVLESSFLNNKHWTQNIILAVIPVYNEAKHIQAVIKETQEYVDQVIIIDDGSEDGTDVIAKAVGATVFKHKYNQGKGAAINYAFRIAREIQPKAMVLLDGDGQHNPKEIPFLLDPVLNGQFDMIVGSRFLRNNSIPKYRMFGQSILTLITNVGSGIKITDTQSGFRTFSLNAINKMTFYENGFAIESEMQFKARQYNLKVSEVPIVTNYDERVKRSPVVHGFGVLLRVLNLIIKSYLSISKR